MQRRRIARLQRAKPQTVSDQRRKILAIFHGSLARQLR
jgi:hypothetical protein